MSSWTSLTGTSSSAAARVAARRAESSIRARRSPRAAAEVPRRGVDRAARAVGAVVADHDGAGAADVARRDDQEGVAPVVQERRGRRAEQRAGEHAVAAACRRRRRRDACVVGGIGDRAPRRRARAQLELGGQVRPSRRCAHPDLSSFHACSCAVVLVALDRRVRITSSWTWRITASASGEQGSGGADRGRGARPSRRKRSAGGCGGHAHTVPDAPAPAIPLVPRLLAGKLRTRSAGPGGCPAVVARLASEPCPGSWTCPCCRCRPSASPRCSTRRATRRCSRYRSAPTGCSPAAPSGA